MCKAGPSAGSGVWATWHRRCWYAGCDHAAALCPIQIDWIVLRLPDVFHDRVVHRKRAIHSLLNSHSYFLTKPRGSQSTPEVYQMCSQYINHSDTHSMLSVRNHVKAPISRSMWCRRVTNATHLRQTLDSRTERIKIRY